MEMLINKIVSNVPLIGYLAAIGSTIPHYCYHSHLSIAGNCRACLIELNGSVKPLVSCTADTVITIQNSKIYHDSVLVKKARENIIEFLLVNHPLDCPICDQGGNCDLQDQAIFFGIIKRRFYKFKRLVRDKNLGGIVKTVMTRCIHCTRCIRFIKEIAGIGQLGILGRGGASEIGTYIEKMLTSELSGNIIDLCPVGSFINNRENRAKKQALIPKATSQKSCFKAFNSKLPIRIR
jgi:NADH dehydrogenase/NADH:ubiquinone oxidoreductase subunit G